MVAYYRQHLDDSPRRPGRSRKSWWSATPSIPPRTRPRGDRTAGKPGVRPAPVCRSGQGRLRRRHGRRRRPPRLDQQGRLVCEALDQALFTLPVGKLSPIIEGPTGFHIVRVTEREEARSRRSWTPRPTSARSSSGSGRRSKSASTWRSSRPARPCGPSSTASPARRSWPSPTGQSGGCEETVSFQLSAFSSWLTAES